TDESKYPFTFKSFPINILLYANNVDSCSAELCIKCIKAKAWKVIGDFPATKFLKIEPLSFRQFDSLSITEKT
ncbi:MAG TPA: hypothetical protein VE572_02495, partial [Nitrososphaeraceae archaeon]|nr:hypothetical protein [Nitrososphaeraceae archaeon]